MTAQYLDKEKVLKAMSECDGNRLDMIETGMAKDIGDLTLRVDKMEMDAEILKMQDQIKGLEHRLGLAQARHPLMDAATASAALQMRKAMTTVTPFGTVAGDVIGS